MNIMCIGCGVGDDPPEDCDYRVPDGDFDPVAFADFAGRITKMVWDDYDRKIAIIRAEIRK